MRAQLLLAAIAAASPAEGAGTEECRAVLEYALDRIPRHGITRACCTSMCT